MTREEACETLTHCIDWAEHCDDAYVDCVPVEALQIALEALKEQEQKNGRWNPIKTRPLDDDEIELWAEQHGCECEEYEEGDDYMCLPPLPYDGQEVLICDASGNIDFYTYNFASQFELGMYDETDEDRPVAWMPLPKPYKRRPE